MPTSRFPAAGHAALRRHRLDVAGHIYLVTSTTASRQRLFLPFDATCAAARCHACSRVMGGSRLLAWVLMPDHAHWLVQTGDGDTLAAWVNRMKSAAARSFNEEAARAGPVWSRAYHDHALRKDEDVRAAARYVVMNPVRAGLVARVGDYPFWNAAWL